MEKKSRAKPSLKLFQHTTVKSEETAKGLHHESVSVVTEDTASAEVLHSEDGHLGSETFCELPAKNFATEKESLEGEQTSRCNSPTNVRQIQEEVADIFPPDNHEVAVVVSWNWDSSQRNSSPKPEKTKSTTPVSQKKRSSKICSPLMRGQLPARRKRLIKKELPSSKSSFVSELRALSEKLQKAKESEQIPDYPENDENELCFEVSNSSTEKLHFRQDHSTFKLENVEKIKNDSFKTLLEDIDDDCLIQCSQEVEKTLQDYPSPLKKSPKIQTLGTVKFDKDSPSRTKTPSKSRAHNIPPRRSPRIRHQNPVATTNVGKLRGNAPDVKRGNSDTLLDEDLVESLLDDDIELLSQIPSPSSILRAEKSKLCSGGNTIPLANGPFLPRNKSQQMLSKQYVQGNINGIVSLVAGPSSAMSVPRGPPVKNTRQLPGSSYTVKNSSSMNHNYMSKKEVVIKKQENVTNRYKKSTLDIEDRTKPFDDSFGDPAICTFLDSVESSALSSPPSSPVKNCENNSSQQQIPSSPPLQCTPEEIEKKKREALERRRKHSHQNSSLNLVKDNLLQDGKTTVQLQHIPSSPTRRYTPEEIEKKRLEALQIKRQQSLFRTTTYSSGPRQRLHKK